MRRDYYCAILSGVLGIWIMPFRMGGFFVDSLGWLAWIAFVPLFVAIWDSSPRRTFILVFITQFIYASGVLLWLNVAIHHYGGLPIWSSLLIMQILVMGILCPYLGGFLALGAYLRSKTKVSWILLAPLMWVLCDFALNYSPFGGFPWANVGYSQHSLSSLIQLVDLTGIYGVTFLIIFINVVLASLLRASLFKHALPLRGIIVVSLLIVITLVYGHVRKDQISQTILKMPTKRIGYVQGNIDQMMKMDPELSQEHLNHYKDLITKITSQGEGIDLLILPETAYPFSINYYQNRIGGFDMPVPLIVGGNTYRNNASKPEGAEFFNSAFMITPGGKIVGRYHKSHLVPLGEYVPLKKLFFFMDTIVPSIVDFSPGTTDKLLSLEDGTKVGATICYEDLFPEVSRSLVNHGAQVLANITNDAWYGWSSAAHQHLAFSQFRAIENRRWLVRSTNTGVSAIINPLGEKSDVTPLFEERVHVTTVGLSQRKSFYTQYGDVFIWGCFLLLAALIFYAIKHNHDA
jgi:apolipoprotein N-acyltransferase